MRTLWSLWNRTQALQIFRLETTAIVWAGGVVARAPAWTILQYILLAIVRSHKCDTSILILQYTLQALCFYRPSCEGRLRIPRLTFSNLVSAELETESCSSYKKVYPIISDSAIFGTRSESQVHVVIKTVVWTASWRSRRVATEGASEWPVEHQTCLTNGSDWLMWTGMAEFLDRKRSPFSRDLVLGRIHFSGWVQDADILYYLDSIRMVQAGPGHRTVPIKNESCCKVLVMHPQKE